MRSDMLQINEYDDDDVILLRNQRTIEDNCNRLFMGQMSFPVNSVSNH